MGSQFCVPCIWIHIPTLIHSQKQLGLCAANRGLQLEMCRLIVAPPSLPRTCPALNSANLVNTEPQHKSVSEKEMLLGGGGGGGG